MATTRDRRGGARVNEKFHGREDARKVRLAAREKPLAASADARREIGRVGGAIASSAARVETDACRALLFFSPNLEESQTPFACGRRKSAEKSVSRKAQSLP